MKTKTIYKLTTPGCPICEKMEAYDKLDYYLIDIKPTLLESWEDWEPALLKAVSPFIDKETNTIQLPLYLFVEAFKQGKDVIAAVGNLEREEFENFIKQVQDEEIIPIVDAEHVVTNDVHLLSEGGARV